MPDNAIAPAEQQDAYALLSKPTKDLTDAEVLLVIADLRKRRFTSLATGKPDKPVKEAKAAKAARVPASREEKARNLALLLDNLKLPEA